MRFFKETAESVLKLDLNREWIIVDDVSSDGTREYASSLVDSNPFVHLINNTKRIGRAWENYERGLKSSQSDYVLFLDHDDTLPSTEALAQGLRFLEENRNIHLVISQVAYMDEYSRIYKVKRIPGATYPGSMSGRRLLWTLFLCPTYPLKQGAVLIRRSLFESTGNKFDIDFVLAATQYSDCGLISYVGLNYRNVRSSASSQRAKTGERFWVNFSKTYFPNDRYWGLQYVFVSYKTILGWGKVLYSLFSPNRV